MLDDDRHQGEILITTVAIMHVICKGILVSPCNCRLIKLSTKKGSPDWRLYRRFGTASGDVQSGSRLGTEKVDATVAGEAVVCIGLNALCTIELDTLSRLEDSVTSISVMIFGVLILFFLNCHGWNT